MAKDIAAVGYRSGFCGVGRHDRCPGAFRGGVLRLCHCPCHDEYAVDLYIAPTPYPPSTVVIQPTPPYLLTGLTS